MYYLEVSYHINGERQAIKPSHGERAYARAGVVPTPIYQRAGSLYPMLRYPWADARSALLALAEDRPDEAAVQVTYINPETGGDAENVLGFYALMLRPGQTLTLPVRSPAQVFHVIEGGAEVAVEAERFALTEADTCCAPGYTPVTLTNARADAPSFLFVADEAPLHRKLGVYEERP
jgi:gentisate 1,2-dioxygenase